MLDKIKLLKDDMKDKGWTICSFMFKYNKTEYIVLVQRFVNQIQRKNQFALVKFVFIKCVNGKLLNELEIEANQQGLIIDAKQLRNYFGIKYSVNLGDILNQFTNQFNQFIPSEVPNTVSEIEKSAMVYSLSKSDSEDPNKIYCTGVKRNSEGRKRSVFNSDKTKLLRPKVYTKFADDQSISFCYADDKTKEKTDKEILENFSNK